VQESALLPALSPDDVRMTLLRTVENTKTTDRQGLTGWLTYYFLEIYDVKFLRDAVLGPLLAAPRESGALWVSETQIRSGQPLRLFFDGAERTVQINGRALLPQGGK
jgi:hypothetical protein